MGEKITEHPKFAKTDKKQLMELTRSAVWTEHSVIAIAQQSKAIIEQKTTDPLAKPILAVPSLFVAAVLLLFPAFYLEKYLQ
jgi:hypothetical protein